MASLEFRLGSFEEMDGGSGAMPVMAPNGTLYGRPASRPSLQGHPCKMISALYEYPQIMKISPQSHPLHIRASLPDAHNFVDIICGCSSPLPTIDVPLLLPPRPTPFAPSLSILPFILQPCRTFFLSSDALLTLERYA